VLLAGLGYPLDLLLGPAAALYLLAARREARAEWEWRTTATVLGLLAAYLAAAGAAQATFPGSELLHTGLAWAVAWFAGERTRLRREQIAELRERALQAEREVERERLLAGAEERARIARDLHDSAGHAINVIAVRAGAARLRHHQDPDRSLLALEAIEDVARQTADDIDKIVGTLRGSGSVSDVVEPPSGLASLETLIGRHREAGLAVTFEASGTPRQLGVSADQGAYRLLQEALTNAARHGAGSARIELAFGEGALELAVSNPVGASRPPPSNGGHGLVGMRERATLLGGSLDVESADGAFRVRARIPYGGHRT
jgi:signal transduction histidine kinase